MHGVWSKTPNKIQNMMYIKIHKSEHSVVVAVCDEYLLGKIIKEGDREIKISNEFYNGKLMNKDQVIKILKEASNVNLIGDEAVSCGIEANIILEEHIMTIGGTKHAQFYSLE